MRGNQSETRDVHKKHKTMIQIIFVANVTT